MHNQRTYRLLHVRGTLYANFGMATAETFRELGYFDERYYLNAADPDFSLKVWNSGRQVVPAYGAMIDHDEHEDARRDGDATHGRADNERLFAKWQLPPRNPTHNDFDPGRPCTLIGMNPPCNQAA
jgi:GT2 family glycosyltransferase